MIQIIQLKGTDRRLYELVAPLVMNPDVLKQNYNYPFRTSEDFVWFVAVEKRKVIGFIPVEEKKKEWKGERREERKRGEERETHPFYFISSYLLSTIHFMPFFIFLSLK